MANTLYFAYLENTTLSVFSTIPFNEIELEGLNPHPQQQYYIQHSYAHIIFEIAQAIFENRIVSQKSQYFFVQAGFLELKEFITVCKGEPANWPIADSIHEYFYNKIQKLLTNPVQDANEIASALDALCLVGDEEDILQRIYWTHAELSRLQHLKNVPASEKEASAQYALRLDELCNHSADYIDKTSQKLTTDIVEVIDILTQYEIDTYQVVFRVLNDDTVPKAVQHALVVKLVTGLQKFKSKQTTDLMPLVQCVLTHQKTILEPSYVATLNPEDFSEHPEVVKWLKTQQAHPAVQYAIEHPYISAGIVLSIAFVAVKGLSALLPLLILTGVVGAGISLINKLKRTIRK